MKRRLVTSALPYVNNVPHLGNLIQVLSADAFSRFCRLYGYETLYICATDEYGTATETKAAEEGITPKELCDRYHQIHSDIYKWFNINFDIFGRTSFNVHTEVTQEIFKELDKAGYITEKTNEQFFCSECSKFLADRFIKGICPKCGSANARGDQCEDCSKLLDPTDLKEPKCSICGNSPSLKKTNHLYIDLPAIKDKLEEWIKTASEKGFWSRNAVQTTKSWIRDGLKPRAITRDLKWGIPVPKQGYENKVFYVWFDAPIGYISMAGALGEKSETEKKSAKNKNDFFNYWWKSPDEVELFQFVGKDNIPFHTVVFPSTLLGTGDNWTMLHHMSSSEYLNYEDDKFSKSRGVGVFGDDAIQTGIPADVWRFYIFYIRPETADAVFTWKDFQEKVNGELIGNFGNLVNRTLSFVTRYYDAEIPSGNNSDSAFWETVNKYEKEIAEKLNRAQLRDAFRQIFELSSFANKYFQDSEPWKLRASDSEEDRRKAAQVISDLTYLVRDLAVLTEPFIPESAAKLASFFGFKLGETLDWTSLGVPALCSNSKIKSEVLFRKLEDEKIDELKLKYSGTQEDRKDKNEGEQSADKKPFTETVDLRVALITKIERHPKADKLYIETLDTGDGAERIIVSGLVPFYKEEELLGKKIIVAYNLKPAKLRGVDSKGMLLAASDKCGYAEDGVPYERVEALDAGGCPVGTRLLPEGETETAPPCEIDIDTFFSYPITVKNYEVYVDGKRLCLNGTPIRTKVIENGEVH